MFKIPHLTGVLVIRLLTAALLVASFGVVADTEVPHTFTDGTPAKASEVNANFDALETAIDAIPEGPAGEQGPAGTQGEKGDKGDTGDTGPQGPIGLTGATGAKGDTGNQGAPGNDGQDGADGVAAGLNCNTDQSIVYRGDAWVCSSPELVFSSFSSGTDSLNSYSTGAVDCPSGKTVFGGGCEFKGLEACHSVKSEPYLNLTGWSCEAQRSNPFNYDCYTASAYAICQ